MHKYFSVLLILLFVLPCMAQLDEADVSGIKNKYTDLPYATLSESQKLDIYLPENGKGPFPIILSIHGGGFMAGDKGDGQVEPMLRGLKQGYAVVAINYRLSGEAIWPAQIYDCKAAVRWIKANAQKYNIDADHIVAWGGSAGGHLSSLLGTSAGVEKLEGSDLGNAGESSRIQAVVDWFGPTNFLRMDQQLNESGFGNPMVHSIPTSPESILLGRNLEDVPSLVKEADPGTYISSDDPPFFIQHGMEDTLVPYQGSVLLARRLGKALGAKNVQLELFPATGHGNGPAFYTTANFDKIFNFIDLHLKSNRETAEQDLSYCSWAQSVEKGPYTVYVIAEGVYHIEDANSSRPAGLKTDKDGKIVDMNNCSDMYLVVGTKQALLVDLSNFIKWDSTAVESLRSIVSERVGNKEFYITFTHKHGDHTGMLPAFRDDPKVKFWIPEAEFKGMNLFPEERTIFFSENGLLDLGGGYLITTTEVPGHTGHGTLFFIKGRDIVFTGDALGSGNGVWLFNYESFITYTRSIENLISYLENPANNINLEKLVIYGGHYWQRGKQEKLTARYVYDMRTLIKKMKQGTAEATPMPSPMRYLDTNFKYGTATITWNKKDAGRYSSE